MINSLQMAFGMTLFAAASCLVVMQLTGDPGAQTSVLYSAVLATVNGLGALFLSSYGARRPSTKGFFRAVFGGMFFRTGTTLIGLVIGLKFLLLPPVSLAASLLTYTALFTAAEVALWSRQDFSPRVRTS